jgi:hypothetical protein
MTEEEDNEIREAAKQQGQEKEDKDLYKTPPSKRNHDESDEDNLKPAATNTKTKRPKQLQKQQTHTLTQPRLTLQQYQRPQSP